MPNMKQDLKSECGSCKLFTSIIQSPIGDIEIVNCFSGLHSVNLCQNDDFTFSPSEQLSVLVKSSLPNTAEYLHAHDAHLWIKNYFEFKQASTKIPPLCPTLFKPDTFSFKALQHLPTAAPFGTTITYKDLAQVCGNAKASRAAGQAMGNNPLLLLIPCHRVICSSGLIGNYAHGRHNKVKQWLLEFEKSSKPLKS